MLKIINDKKMISFAQAQSKFVNSKAILVLEKNYDMNNLKGYVYAISLADDSFQELCEESEKLRKNGCQNMIVGTYSNGGVVGVQYINSK